MFKRRLLAFVAGLTIGFPSLSTATLLSENFANMPSSFVEKTKRSNITSGQLDNKATTGLTGKTGIFSQYKFPGVSFDSAATKGLSAARPETKSKSVGQLIAAASLRRGLYGDSIGSTGAESSPPPTPTLPNRAQSTGPTLRKLAKAVVNVPAPGTTPSPEGRVANEGGFSFVDVVLGTQLDDAFIDAATDVITPTITPDGVVALDLMGLRDFAFMVSPITNKIQILDFKTGTTLTIDNSAHNKSGDLSEGLRPYRPYRSANPSYLGDHPAVKMLKALKAFVGDFLLHPITLGALLLAAMCWGAIGLIPRWR